jgi:phosphoglycerol transferase MdoB-like AlkP superfamily enzyme
MVPVSSANHSLPDRDYRWFSWTVWKRVTSLWALVVVFGFLFMEVATPTFITEYDTRPNRLFIEYLNYPKEVLSMLWEGYLPTVVTGIFLCVSLTALFVWLMRPRLLPAWRP